MNYELLNKDRCIAAFSTERSAYGGVSISGVRVLRPDGLPAGYRGMRSFLEHRRAPKHREHIQTILRQLGADDLEGFLRVSHAASLIDTFWVRAEGESLCWQEVSLYQNEFDDLIARLAFSGGSGASLTSTTPELTVNGQFAKCWIRERVTGNAGEETSEQSALYLLKRSSRAYQREVYSEFYASQLAELLCPEAVHYDLVLHHETVASKCACFTTEEAGYAEITSFVKDRYEVTVPELLDLYASVGSEQAFRRMLVLDALIANTDRHLGNFGLLIHNDTQQPIRMAPVFDQNRSLFYHLSDEQVDRMQFDRIIDCYPRIGGDFNLVAHELLTPEIVQDLKNLSGFRFRRHEAYNLPEGRVRKLESFVNRQIDAILAGIPLVKW